MAEIAFSLLFKEFVKKQAPIKYKREPNIQ